MNKPTLWVMVGLSGSGKSSVAKEIAENNSNTIIVSLDNICEELTGKVEDQSKNEEVSKVFHKRIRETLENNTNVVADATNITMRSRRAIIENVKSIECHKIVYLIPKPFRQCKIDNLNRQHPVPEEVLNGQLRKFQIPFMEEKFDEIRIEILHKENRLTLEEMFSMMKGFNQKNPHHTMDLYEHCQFVKKKFSKMRGYIYTEYPFAAKLHDVGKLFTQKFDEDGIAHYFQHENVGTYYLLSNIENIKFYRDYSDEHILNILFLVNYHMMPFNWTTEKSKERWKKRFGEYKYQMLLDFHECDKAR